VLIYEVDLVVDTRGENYDKRGHGTEAGSLQIFL
jgi:hypothetical protein